MSGCLAYQRKGLDSPEAVRAVTNAHRLESDGVGRWLEECVVIDPANEELWESSAALTAAYDDWSAANGSPKAKRGQIKKRLETDHGCKDRKNRVERAGGVSQLHGILGVRLR